MKQKLRQPLSILLTLLMLLTLLPATAFATDGSDGTKNPYAHEDHTGYTEWTNTGALPDKEGEYYLSNDITLSANWDVPGETVLCLNGHNVDLNTYHFEVGKGEHLVICDCSTVVVHAGYLDPENYDLWTPGEGNGETCNLTGGVIYGGVSTEDSTGSCINAAEGDVTIAGGNIAGNLNWKDNRTNSEGTVRIRSGNFTMYGGSITGNYAYHYGGGIYVSGTSRLGSKVSLYGGEICHNTSEYGGGGVYTSPYVDFLLDGGSIEYNKTGFGRSDSYGGGVTVSGVVGDAAEIKSGSICYNACNGMGGGIYLSGSGYVDSDFFTMTGGLIQGNYASRYGGGIGISRGAAEITGGTITGNTAEDFGGGIRAGSSSLTIGTNVNFSGNTSQTAGSDLAFINSATSSAMLSLAKPKSDGDAERYWFDDTPELRYEGNEGSVEQHEGNIKSKESEYLIAATGIPAYAIDVDPLEHGSITADPSGEVAADTEITLTVTPEKGYELKEDSLKVTYTTDAGEQTVPVTDNKFNMPAADVTVSAEFVATEYDITYELDGGTNAEGNPDTYTVEQDITLSAPTRAGYTFTGWTWDGQTEPQTTVNLAAGSVTGDLTFTANWQEIAYTIAVGEIEHGSITANPSGEVAVNTEVELTVTPEEGYELKEDSLKVTYTTDAGEQTVPVTDNKFKMPAADVTVSAEFVATEYSITYELDGGANAEGNPDTYTVEQDITLSAPTRAGYTFTGWTWDGQTEPQTTVNLAAGSVTGDLTFTANWKIKLPDVPVIDPDDDDDDEPGTVTPDDTGVSDWLDTKNHIQYLSGYGEGKFGPEDNMTRAQAAQMFYNLLLDKDVAITVSFSDVAENAWYAEAVNTLASLGIVDGVGGGLYAPERAITRAEFTVIAMRFAHLDTGGENIFSDVSRSDWFYDQVVGSVKYGWINGYADGTFRPNNTITRAEVTTIVNRMLGRSADREYVDANIGSLTQFNDISRAHWAYYEVMEAANAHDYAIVNGKEDWK